MYKHVNVPAPTEPGWWWFQDVGGGIECPVYVLPNMRIRATLSSLCALNLPSFGEEWAIDSKILWTGPIPGPPRVEGQHGKQDVYGQSMANLEAGNNN